MAAWAATAGVLGVGVFGATLYALPQYLVPALEPLRVGVIAAALMYVGLVGRWIMGGEAPTFGGIPGMGLVLVIAIAALSPAWSLDPAASRSASIELLKMGIAYVAVVGLVDRPDRLRRVIWAVGLAASVPAFFAVHNYVNGINLLEGYRARWEGSFFDPNRLGMGLTASSLLLIGQRARIRRAWTHLVVLALVALQVAAVVVTYSRGAALGLATGFLVYVLSGRGTRVQSVVIAGAVAIALLGLAPERFWKRTETIATFEEDASALGRIHAWQTAGNILAARPLTGVGEGAFVAAWATYAPPEAGARAYVAHNVFLEVAAELGIVALVGFAVLAAGTLAGAFSASRSGSPVREEARGIVAALAGYLVCQLFAGYLLSFFLFLFMGLAAAADRIARRARVSEGAVR